jgi:glycosyltransferase involved in cell wall biosynthesis
MACGTPVIAWSSGAMPEIVDQGVTGFIVDSMEDAVASVPDMLRLDRRKVRAAFERRFSAERMTRDYVSAYMRLIGASAEARAS